LFFLLGESFSCCSARKAVLHVVSSAAAPCRLEMRVGRCSVQGRQRSPVLETRSYLENGQRWGSRVARCHVSYQDYFVPPEVGDAARISARATDSRCGLLHRGYLNFQKSLRRVPSHDSESRAEDTSAVSANAAGKFWLVGILTRCSVIIPTLSGDALCSRGRSETKRHCQRNSVLRRVPCICIACT
jgi:hypothetical protein